MNYDSEVNVKIREAKQLIEKASILLFEAQTARGKDDLKTSYLDRVVSVAITLRESAEKL